MTYVYIRDSEYRGHVIGDNYSCKFCKMAQNSWGNIDKDCPGKVASRESITIKINLSKEEILKLYELSDLKQVDLRRVIEIMVREALNSEK